MYVAEIISCSNQYYWYSNKIGEFFVIYDDKIYSSYYGISDNTISDYKSGIIEIKDKTKYRIAVNKVKFLSMNDIKIHTERSMKLKQLRCT